MGFISELASGKSAERVSFPGERMGRVLWRTTFGQTTKEDLHKFPKVRNGFANSATTAASIKRLIEAMRSMAPGGWSDDRYEQTKHFLSIAYISIHRKCEQLAQSEFTVFIKDDNHPDGKRHVPKWHSAYKLNKLLECPNPQDSFGDLMYRTGQQMDLTGKALTWMFPNVLGVPIELYTIPTAIAIPQPCINPDYPDGFYRIQPVYPYGPFSSYPTPSSAVGAPIPAQWMLEIKYPHPLLRYDGYSPLTGLRLEMDEVESMSRSRWYKMKRSINPSAVLDMNEMEGGQPLPEEELARIHAEWEAEFMGSENAGKLVVTAPGCKLSEFGASPREMDYPSSWDQLVAFVMAGFGITKPAAGMVEDSSYSTLFATLKQLHLLTLQPLCNRIAARFTRQLAIFFGDDLIVEIKCPRIDDHEQIKADIDQAIQAKAITKNEVRKKLESINLPVTKEPWGEEIAGFEKPPEQPMPGMGMPGGEPAPQLGDGLPKEKPVDVKKEPPEVSQSRPGTGELGQGALGPRKGLKHLRKMLRNRMGLNGYSRNGVVHA